MTSQRIAWPDGWGDRSPAARRIMAAADDLFFRKGATATTVREITAACDLTPGALYNHFSSKEDLLFQLVMGRHLLLAAALDDALRDAPRDDPVARLASSVRVFVRVHTRPGAHQGARIANREYRALGSARRAQVVAVRRDLRDRLRDVLVDGSVQGAFVLAGGCDSRAAALVASAIIDMCVHASEWLRADGPLTLDAVEDRYVEMALRMAGAR